MLWSILNILRNNANTGVRCGNNSVMLFTARCLTIKQL